MAAEELHGLAELRTLSLCGLVRDTEDEDEELDAIRAATPSHVAIAVADAADGGAAEEEAVDRWASGLTN